MDNNDLIRHLNAIDRYNSESDFLVDENTKRTLKSLLISGADPDSDNFKDKFIDEYHLYRKIREMLNYRA